ncbi:MAG: DUF481 domain-containing protein [Planctomycetota bacterium]
MNLFSLHGAAAAAVACSFTALSISSAHAGTVTLTNDDTITGTVTSQTDDGVTVEHPDLGTLNLDAAQVAGVELEESDPIYVEPPVPDFFLGWDKTLSAGVNGSDGNTESLSVYAAFDTGYEDKNDRWDFNARVFYGEEDGVNTRNEYQAQLTKDWLLPDEDYFFFANLKYENDRFTGWEERTSGYLGVGYDVIKRDNYMVVARLGVGGSYEAGVINEFTPELMVGVEGEWTIDDRSSLKYYTYFFPYLDPVFDEFRNTTGLAYQIAIDQGKGISLRLGAENEYNSAAAAGTEENDLKYFMALVYDF